MIRRALTSDVSAFGQIINNAAETGSMLHRSLAELYENVRNFHIAVENDQVVGVCGLKVVWADLAEIYALAVTQEMRGRGWGRRLVQACIADARSVGTRRLMSLTYEKTLFQKLGFAVVDRQQLPLKVWSECLRCSKNKCCDEIAMIYVLEDLPTLTESVPAVPQPGEYVVPVELKIGAQPNRQKMDEAR